jgi:hypothetical protein
MLASSVPKPTIRSYTSTDIAMTSMPDALFDGAVGSSLCCDGNGVLYFIKYDGSLTNYYKINPTTGVVTTGLATGRVIQALSVTQNGTVFFAVGNSSVFAVGGTYGSTPVLLFTPAGGSGVWRQAMCVNSTGTEVYCYDGVEVSIGGFQGGYLCKYTAWSGGSATRTVISTSRPGDTINGFGYVGVTDGGMVATGPTNSTGGALMNWYGPLTSLSGLSYTGVIAYGRGFALDSDMSPIILLGTTPFVSPPNNGAATLQKYTPGNSTPINIPITAWTGVGVAVHPLTRVIYVVSYGTSSLPSGNVGRLFTFTPVY